jgi:hypothetical protein
LLEEKGGRACSEVLEQAFYFECPFLKYLNFLAFCQSDSYIALEQDFLKGVEIMKTALSPSSTRKSQIRLSSRKPSATKKDQKPVALLELEQLAWKIDFIVQNIKYPEAFVKDLVKSFRAIA